MITHIAIPGPDYWSYRCLRCSCPVDQHHTRWWVWWKKISMFRRLQGLSRRMDMVSYDHFLAETAHFHQQRPDAA